MTLALCCADCLGKLGDDFEEIADDTVVGYFKDRGVLVFVDGDDGLRSLHTDEMLDGSGDSDGEVQLWRDGLAGRADLALHGEPAVVADRARGGEFGAEGLG